MKTEAVLVLSLCCALFAPHARAVVLAERGGSAAPVVVSAQASESERKAAREYAWHVRLTTGVKPAIVTDAEELPAKALVLGRTRHTAALLGAEPDWKDLGDDGFRVVAKGGRVLVIGSNVRGALYGAFDVLERFAGVAWLSAARTVTPEIARLEVPDNTDYSEKPAFRMRDAYWWDAVRVPSFAAHMRLNGQRTRIGPELGGTFGRFDAKLGSCHTFARLVPTKDYFATHPEYFSEVKGKRVEVNTQLCLSNPDVLKIVTEAVLARIRENPSADFYGVSQNDWDNHCTCAQCAAVDAEEGSPSGIILRFVNKVAEAVEREFPTKMVETLAYSYGRMPPKITKARHNVLICLCSDHVDHGRPLDDPDSELNARFASAVRGWGEITRNIYLWDYTTDFGHYLNAMPNMKCLGPNLRFFHENGVNFMFEQGNALGKHGDFAELKTYLLAKYMWNPNQPEEPLLKKFFEGYYGAGAPYARQCFDLVTALPRQRPLSMRDGPDAKWLTDEYLEKADALWKQACAATADDPAANRCCRMARAGTVYSILWRNRKRFLTAWCTREPEKFRPAVERLGEQARFFGQCWKECPQLRFVENKDRCQTANRLLARICAIDVPKAGCDRVEIPSDLFHQQYEWTDHNKDGRTRYEKDPLATDGWAMWLNPKHRGDAMNFYLGDELAYDEGATYRLRVRVRVARDPKGDADAEAFRVCVYDDVKNRHVKPPLNVKASAVNEAGYVWYDVFDFKPAKGHRIVIHPGRFKAAPAVTGAWIDRCELSRVDCGFWRVRKDADGYWTFVDPDGRDVFVRGVEQVVWRGHGVPRHVPKEGRPETYREWNERHYPSKQAWADETFARLRDWGFNTLGSWSDETLLHRGMGYFHHVGFGMDWFVNPKFEPDLMIRRKVGRFFPNVFSEKWPEHCRAFATRRLKDVANDRDLIGIYLDGELPWWGENGTGDRETGLVDLIRAQPEGHSARKALEAFMAARPDAWSRAARLAFVARAADLYYRTTYEAIRAVDKNHMIVGEMFAGLHGFGSDEALTISAKYCDVITIDLYPSVDLEKGVVTTQGTDHADRMGDGGAVVGLMTWLENTSKKLNRPFHITEWSFPVYEGLKGSDYPCVNGGGQRYRYRRDRAKAAELYVENVNACPAVAGYNYFMWVDAPNCTPHTAECSYGLVTVRGEVDVVLTDMFRAFHRTADAKRKAGYPAARPFVPPMPAAEPAAACAARLFANLPDAGGARFDAASVPLRHFRARKPETEKWWWLRPKAPRTISEETQGTLLVRTEAIDLTNGGHDLVATVRTWLGRDGRSMVRELVSIENRGKPVELASLYWTFTPPAPLTQRVVVSPPRWCTWRPWVDMRIPWGAKDVLRVQSPDNTVFGETRELPGKPLDPPDLMVSPDRVFAAGEKWTPSEPTYYIFTLESK